MNDKKLKLLVAAVAVGVLMAGGVLQAQDASSSPATPPTTPVASPEASPAPSPAPSTAPDTSASPKGDKNGCGANSCAAPVPSASPGK